MRWSLFCLMGNAFCLARNLFCLMGAMFVLAGCNNAAISPTDQSMLKETAMVSKPLAPALVDVKLTRLEWYFEQIMKRILTSAKELDGQKAIGGNNQGSALMFAADVDVHLLNSDLMNAATLGGQQIYIYNGLLQQCKNEDELAAMICHQFAHIYSRHVQSDRVVPENPKDANAVLEAYVRMRISPSHCRDADATAFMIFAKAGWDPTRFASMAERMISQGGSSTADRNILRETIQLAQKKLDELPTAAREWSQVPIADEARFIELQNQARSTAKGMAKDGRAELICESLGSCFVAQPTRGMLAARETLFPPPPLNSDNKWGKGLGK